MAKAMNQLEEEKRLLSSFLSSDLYTQMPQGGESRARPRRKKAKGDDTTGGEAKKRRLSAEQVEFLEITFGKERKLESERKLHLASELGLDPKQVAVWFQNRRARWKNKQLEGEYLKLKSMHDAVVVEKCHLENEVLKLKEQLSEAGEEIRKLSGGLNGASGGERSGSPTSSSLSTNTHQPLLGVEGNEDLIYMYEYNYMNMMEWMNPYGM